MIIKEFHACFNYIESVIINPNFTRLCVLSLSCNHLKEIPDLCNVVCLRELYLSNNDIMQITNLHCLSNLECLDLRNNAICCMENISQNNRLIRLTLSGNRINTVDTFNLPVLQHMEFIGLFDNQIADVKDVLQLLYHTPSLHHLYIGCNPFTGGQTLSIQCNLLNSLPHISTVTDICLQQLMQKANRLITEIKKHCPSITCIDGNYIY